MEIIKKYFIKIQLIAQIIWQNEYLIFGILLFASIFLHFFAITSNLYYLDDAAIQSNAVKQMWVTHTPAINGPGASISNTEGFTHGAFYYYFFLIPGVFFHFSPLGYGIFVGTLSTVAGILLYFSTKSIFSRSIATLTYLFYLISYNINFYGRAQINPDNIPFFAALVLFSLIQFFRGKKYYLILLFFSASAITQLHITGYIFIPIVLILIPFLWKKCKDTKIWILSSLGFLLPWIPTIVQQYKYNFPILKFILHLFSGQRHIGLLGHFLNGYGHMVNIFEQLFQLGSFLPIIIIIAGICILLRYYKRTGNDTLRVSIVFIYLILLATFLMFAMYPGDSYIDYGEQLFIIYPILLALFVVFFWNIREMIPVSILIIFIVFETNLILDKNDILFGKKLYLYQNKICQIIKSHGYTNYSVIITGQFDINIPSQTLYNPYFIEYLCTNEYGFIKTPGKGKEAMYTINTDYKTQLRYTLKTQ